MTSRAKKRIVLPSRPDPPTVEQILEDVRSAVASDPVFICDFNDAESVIPAHDASSDRDKQYSQSSSYMQLNNKLRESQVELKERCEALRLSGMKLGSAIEELREAAMYEFSLWHSADDTDVALAISAILEQSGYRGFVEHRDQAAGELAISSATAVIESSRVSFIILSSHFLEETWCKWVSEWCLVSAIERNPAKVVPVYTDDVQENQKPDILLFLNSLNYHSEFFKKKLLATMRRKAL